MRFKWLGGEFQIFKLRNDNIYFWKFCRERTYAWSRGYFVAVWFIFGALLLYSFAEISDLPMLLELEKQIIGRIRFLSICLSCGLW